MMENEECGDETAGEAYRRTSFDPLYAQVSFGSLDRSHLYILLHFFDGNGSL